MAERDQKIYPALPQRRQRAHEQGNVARSRDLSAAISFTAAVIIVAGTTGALARVMLGAFKAALAGANSNDLGAAIRRAFELPLSVALLLSGLLAAFAAAGAIAQGGLVFAADKLAPDFSRLNPKNYFARIFSTSGLLELGKATLKIIVVATVAWSTAKAALGAGMDAHSITAAIAAMAIASRRLLYFSAAVALAVAVVDYAYKYYEHEAGLRMTRQELMDELKQEEGNPEVKRAIKKARRKKFRRIRGIHQAAAATVVLTNPTHLAVALRYRRGYDQAPLVVAKGAGEQAQRIIAIARMAAVPVMQNKPLARALFKATEVGDQIPWQFYRAIAEVLAALMRADTQRKPMGQAI